MPSKASQSNVRQRTDQIDVFTTETSCLAIVWATIQDIRLHPHLGVILLRSESGKSSQQPAREGGSAGGGFCSLSWGAPAMRAVSFPDFTAFSADALCELSFVRIFTQFAR
jgi:hypothetical protein